MQIRIDVESKKARLEVRREAGRQGKRMPRMGEEIVWAGLAVIRQKNFATNLDSKFNNLEQGEARP